MIRFDEEILELLRQLAEGCSGKPGYAVEVTTAKGKTKLIGVVEGHRLFAQLVRQRLADRLSPQQLAIIEFCAEECIWQDDTEVPMATVHMIRTYDFALRNLDSLNVTLDQIKAMYRLIKPMDNPFGFRSMPVTLGGRVIPAEHLDREVGSLCAEQGAMTPEEFFLWLEYYHPGNDGNGRVGAILFNLKNLTLEAPVKSPHYRDPRTLQTYQSAFGEIEGTET